jgi:hypothetical protein
MKQFDQFHIVRKDGTTIRKTQDYKKLNSVTIKDAYPLPDIESMLSRLAEARVFSGSHTWVLEKWNGGK